MNKLLNKTVIEKLKAVFSQNKEIVAVYLFGSRINGFAKTGSDLDLAIFVTNRNKISERMILKSFVNKDFGIPYEIDLVCADLDSPPILLLQIIKNGVCIYEKNKSQKVDLEAKIMNIYYDNQYMRNIYNYYLEKSLQEGSYGH
jgi:predicted nucleotidyltransferase